MPVAMQSPSEATNNESYQRFAIYWAPDPQSHLFHFLQRWFTAPAEIAASTGLETSEIETAVAEPKRYGPHATLLAPFALADGASLTDIRSHLRAFAARRTPIALGRLKLERIGSFLALTAPDNESQIRALHIQCLFAFETFRREQNAAERARREADADETTPRLLVAQWGYAHVLHLYRFHLSLTGSLGEKVLSDLIAELSGELEKLNAEPAVLDSLCLFGDPGNGEPFALITQCPLEAEASPGK